MERLKKPPEILREGNADAVRFVKENAEKSGCMTPPVEHLYEGDFGGGGGGERGLAGGLEVRVAPPPKSNGSDKATATTVLGSLRSPRKCGGSSLRSE